MYKCLCCGCPTLPDPPENAVGFICPVCWWENDVFIHGEDEPSDENRGLTLRQARKNYAQYGICDERLHVDTLMGWRDVMKKALKSANTFEIHCWKEEEEPIEIALRYGKIKETDWAYGSVIAGKITGDFTRMLLSLPKPADTEIYDKRTPFFSIFLDNGFSSEHYGTEYHFPE